MPTDPMMVHVRMKGDWNELLVTSEEIDWDNVMLGCLLCTKLTPIGPTIEARKRHYEDVHGWKGVGEA